MRRRKFLCNIAMLLCMISVLLVASAVCHKVFDTGKREGNSAKAENTGMQRELSEKQQLKTERTGEGDRLESGYAGEGNTIESEHIGEGETGSPNTKKRGEEKEENPDSTEEKLMEIFGKRDEYPDYLLETLEKYPETIDFVLHYPEYKDKTLPLEAEEYDEGEIPLFIQWDEHWGYAPYGDSLIGVAGCGPVCLSMVAVGLTGNRIYAPEWMAHFSEENGYWVKGSGTAWLLMSEGAEWLGLQAERIPLSSSKIIKELKAGHPLICSMKPGDFTYTGHFIVLVGIKGDKIIVNDPNSRINSGKRWKMDKLLPQMKAVWSYSVMD